MNRKEIRGSNKKFNKKSTLDTTRNKTCIKLLKNVKNTNVYYNLYKLI